MENPLKGAKVRSVKTFHLGDNVHHVVIGASVEEAETEVKRIVKAALKKGATVEHQDGTKEWIEYEAVRTDPDDCESYLWHEDGNRLRVIRFRVEKLTDGARVRTQTGLVWMSWDTYWK